MQDRPSARELVAAVAQFLDQELSPVLADPRLKFRALVAANVLQIVGRELDLGEEQVRAEWHRLNALMGEDAPGEELRAEVETMTRALCARIRAGEVDAGAFREDVLTHVEKTVIEKLEIANPRYLERVLKE